MLRIITVLLALFAGYTLYWGWPSWEFALKKNAALEKDERQLFFWHGDEFLKQCALADSNGSDSAKAQFAVCTSYVVAVADSMELVSPGLTNICRSEPHNGAQLYKVAADWIKAHPMEQRRPAAKLISMAFEETWPCVVTLDSKGKAAPNTDRML